MNQRALAPSVILSKYQPDNNTDEQTTVAGYRYSIGRDVTVEPFDWLERSGAKTTRKRKV